MGYWYPTFGTTAIPLTNAEQDLSSGDAPSDLIALANGGSFDPRGTDQLLPASVVLTLHGEITGATPLAVYQTFAAWKALRGTRNRLWRQEQGVLGVEWAWARLISVKASATSAHYFQLPVDLTFEVQSSIWNGLRHGTAVNPLDASTGFDLEYALDDVADLTTLNTSPKTFTQSNGGNATVANAILTITCGAVAITSVRIQCGAADFTWTGTLATTKQLVIDCGGLSITNDGADAYSGLTLNAGHTIDDWLQLAPGANSITVTLTGGSTNSTILFSYYDGWAS